MMERLGIYSFCWPLSGDSGGKDGGGLFASLPWGIEFSGIPHKISKSRCRKESLNNLTLIFHFHANLLSTAALPKLVPKHWFCPRISYKRLSIAIAFINYNQSFKGSIVNHSHMCLIFFFFFCFCFCFYFCFWKGYVSNLNRRNVY